MKTRLKNRTSVWKVLEKLFLVAMFIPCLVIWVIYAALSWLIDFHAHAKDMEIMSDEKAKQRSIDRTHQRNHDLLNFWVDYFKAFFVS